MKVRSLAREAAATALAGRIPTVLVAALCAAMCAIVLATVGQTAANDARILARIDAAGSRAIVVQDTKQAGLLTGQVIGAIAALSIVEHAAGVTVARDVTVGWSDGAGDKVVSWYLVGEVGSVVTLVSGRLPGPGEAVVSELAAARMGLDGPAGWVEQAGEQAGVVGVFRPRPGFEDFGKGVLIAAMPGTVAAALHVVAHSYQDVGAVEGLALRMIGAQSDGLSISSPAELARLQREVSQDLTRYGRGLALAVLAAGAGLVAIVVGAEVLMRRVDLGRRRALGICRIDLIALVTLRTGFPAIAGALIGTAAGLGWCARVGFMPPATFAVGVSVLSIVAALGAGVLPAVGAALADPVRVLRTA